MHGLMISETIKIDNYFPVLHLLINGLQRRASPLFHLSKFFFSEKLALPAANTTITTTTTTIQYYR